MPDDARSLLLQMLAAQGGGQGAAPAELLASMGGDDPTLGLLARALSARGDEGQGEQEEEVDEEEEDGLFERAMTSLVGEEESSFLPSGGSHRLRERCDALVEENARLIEMHTTLAAALGACPDCWGADPVCARCGGAGGPGAFVPHPGLFREIVLPAVRRWKARADTTNRPENGRASRGDLA